MPDTASIPSSPVTEPPPPSIVVKPWVDPVVDDDGFDARSRYVETFWLSVLGPTATWLIRRLVAGLERSPEGYELDLAATAQAMGLSFSKGRTSPFAKALERCVMFGLAHPIEGGLAVRRRVPPVSYRHLRRMPDAVQAEHANWLNTCPDGEQFDRAHRLAAAMLDTGDDPLVIEHHLIALGVADAVAAQVADNAYRLSQAS